jgi:ferredoxin
MDCVEVCPVDCFYVGENMLVIHPDEWIDCGVCVPECPAEAIFADSDIPPDPDWLGLNRKYAALWPNIVAKGMPPPDADAWNGVPGKFSGHFSPNPGIRRGPRRADRPSNRRRGRRRQSIESSSDQRRRLGMTSQRADYRRS